MQQSATVRLAIAKAGEAIDAVAAARSLDEFEDAWIEYLRRLERFWNKSPAHFSKSPKWAGWSGRYSTERRQDPLLAYLTNARGADEHTVEPITERSGAGFDINPTEGNSLHIERMEFRGGEVFVQSPQSIKITFSPARTRLLPVVNRGRSYPIPTLHRGRPVDPTDVLGVARLGLSYYTQFLDAAEAFLCSA